MFTWLVVSSQRSKATANTHTKVQHTQQLMAKHENSASARTENEFVPDKYVNTKHIRDI